MGAGCQASLDDLHSLERLARRASPIHALDARVKLLATLAFALAVVSMPKFALGELLPFFLFPAFLLVRSNVPLRLVASRVLAVSPFIVMVGAFNPLFDTSPFIQVSGIAISGGWISFASIVLRGLLSVSALVLLAATTDIPGLADAAGRLGLPSVFVNQLLGLYRYLFLLVEESGRMLNAFRLRSPGKKAPKAGIFASLLGQLLLRSLARAERVHQAMWLRGFEGALPRLRRQRMTACDGRFLGLWLLLLAIARFLDPAQWIGRLAMGGL
jgi:cobalt/nickel transport system permease protein